MHKGTNCSMEQTKNLENKSSCILKFSIWQSFSVRRDKMYFLTNKNQTKKTKKPNQNKTPYNSSSFIFLFSSVTLSNLYNSIFKLIVINDTIYYETISWQPLYWDFVHITSLLFMPTLQIMCYHYFNQWLSFSLEFKWFAQGQISRKWGREYVKPRSA